MAVVFIESGGDATLGLQHYVASAGLVTVDQSVAYTGPASIKCDTAAGNAEAYFTNNQAADAGRRISFRFRFSALPAATANICTLSTSGINPVASVRLRADGKLQLGADTLAVGSTALAVNTWYRISFAYTITSGTVNQFRIFLNGSLEVTKTNANLQFTGAFYHTLGWVFNLPGVNTVAWYHDVYMDNLTTLTDPGNGAVTAKRPAAHSTNQFGTAIGANPANRWTNVNERPISQTNGWQSTGSASQFETYMAEAAAVGDANLTGATLLGHTPWAWGACAAGTPPSVNVVAPNGTGYGVTVSTTPQMLAPGAISDSAYPTGGFGLNRLSGSVQAILYECGLLIAYIPAPVTLRGRKTLSGIGTGAGKRQMRQ